LNPTEVLQLSQLLQYALLGGGTQKWGKTHASELSHLKQGSWVILK